MEEILNDDCGIHQDIIYKVSKVMPDEAVLYNAAELFKVFGDSTRIRIIFVLGQSEMCVSDIANLLEMTQPAIFYQLCIFKQSRLVKVCRSTETIFYSLYDARVQRIFYCSMEHVMEQEL